MSSYVIPLFPAAAASPLPTRDALSAELSRLRDRVDASLPGKADKAPPSDAGNLASLDASGNLADSGATPESIKAAAVAEVVANAPGTMDTLEEIADILGSVQQSGTVLKRISDLESGKADSSSLAAVATSGSYADLSGTPAIPAVDAALATRGAAADAKAVGDALRSGFTEWVCDEISEGWAFVGCEFMRIGTSSLYAWKVVVGHDGSVYNLFDASGAGQDAVELDVSSQGVAEVKVSRHLITPTKTSQLKNDGDGTNAFVKTNDARLSDARTPTAHHATHAANGSDPIALADIGAAAASDLPYRQVTLTTPTVWLFSGSGVQSGHAYSIVETNMGAYWNYVLMDNGTQVSSADIGEKQTTVDFSASGDPQVNITATLSGYAILDRASCKLTTSSAATLVHPSALGGGRLRDFILRLVLSGESVPTITFAAPTGETIVYETDGDEFPVPDEAGTWLYSFTESDTSTFAVSLKKVNVVTQGGS